MRFCISQKLRQLIVRNQKLLRNKQFPYQYKNWVYRNKSISESHLDLLCQYLCVPSRQFKKRRYQYGYEKNFGRNYVFVKVRFRGINNDFSELVGIMLGDGGIYQNNVTVTLHRDEREYQNYVKKLFQNVFGITPRVYENNQGRSTRLYLYNKEIVEIFLRYGLQRGDKVSNNARIPEWVFGKSEYMVSCLRGLIDTDGTIVYHLRDKGIYVGFKNYSGGLVEDVLTLTRNLGYAFILASSESGSVYLYKQSLVKKFMKEIGLANNKHIKRYTKFAQLKGL